MPHARREPCFTAMGEVLDIVLNGESDVDSDFTETDARDVMDIVLNGESDVDIDFTETDESDEEACGEESQEDYYPRDAHIQPPRPAKHAKYQWQKKNFVSPNTDFAGPSLTEDVSSLHTPLQYFRRFVSEDMIDSLTTSTNVYSLQATGTSVNTSRKEIEQMMGMYLKMGLVRMNGCRMYWEADTRIPAVADVMPHNRFQSLLTSLHLVDNLTVPERAKKDKLWKIRPWLNSFREKCLQVVPEEHNSVYETMIPFKGRSGVEQYMRGKLTTPWGFKLWVRAGTSGMVCDIDVYQGSSGGIQAKSERGLSGDVVMKLASTLPSGQNYKIYADNFTPLLVESLLGRGIHYTGTTRQVRPPNCKFSLRARRWYMYIFWHTITLAVVNAWLLYKRDCEALKVPPKDVLKLRIFQSRLASSLILVGAAVKMPKSEQPSSAQKRQLEESPNCAPRKAPRQHRPSDVRHDQVGHFPMKTKKGRCRNSGCSGYTIVLCHKCDVRLCLSGDRNCFWDYHC